MHFTKVSQICQYVAQPIGSSNHLEANMPEPNSQGKINKGCASIRQEPWLRKFMHKATLPLSSDTTTGTKYELF